MITAQQARLELSARRSRLPLTDSDGFAIRCIYTMKIKASEQTLWGMFVRFFSGVWGAGFYRRRCGLHDIRSFLFGDFFAQLHQDRCSLGPGGSGSFMRSPAPEDISFRKPRPSKLPCTAVLDTLYKTTPSLKIEISLAPRSSVLVLSPLAMRITKSSRRAPISSRLSPWTTVPASKSIQFPFL